MSEIENVGVQSEGINNLEMDQEDQIKLDEEDDQNVTLNGQTIQLILTQISQMPTNDQLQYLKALQRKQERKITILRELNNKRRDELKESAKKLEKLVDINVKKQIAQELKLNGPYNYMGEQQILKEILEKKKTKEDFKDLIEPSILDRLLAINQQLQTNNELRSEIQSIKSKNIHINHVNKVQDLNNIYKMKERQRKGFEDNKNKLYTTLQEQNAIVNQLLKDFNYKERIEGLKGEYREQQNLLKDLQIQEILMDKKAQKQSQQFTELEKEYRSSSLKLGQFGNPMDLNVEEIKEFKKKYKETDSEDKMIKYKQRQEKLAYTLKEQELDITEQEKKRLEEFKKQPELYEETVDKLYNLRIQVEEIEKKYKLKIKDCNQQIASAEIELKDLFKKFKERDHEAQIAVSKLNEIQRVAMTKKGDKPTAELTLSNVPTQKMFIIKDVKENDFKKNIRKQLTEPRGRDFTRLAGGNFSQTESYIIFDDGLSLKQSYQPPQLIEICVYHTRNGIYGISGRYKFYSEEENEQIIQGPLNYTEFSSIEKTILKIQNDDQIKFFSGLFNDQIFYLRIETIQRNYIEVGDMKLRDSNSQEFRLDIKKDYKPIALIGVIDFTQKSKNLNDKFLVAVGVELQIPQDQFRGNKKGSDIEENIESNDDEKVEDNQNKIMRSRKIKYKLKKAQNNSLLIHANESSSVDPKDPHYQFQLKEKLRLEKIKLELSPPKKFNPLSYKDKQYIEEEKRRRELSKLREKKLEDYLETTKAKLPRNESQPKHIKSHTAGQK